MSTTYLEAIREGLWEEMERDPNVFCIGEDIGDYGGAFKVTAGFLEQFGATPRGGYADFRSRHRGRGHRRRPDGPAARGGDAVRRFHLLRLRPDRQLRRQVPLPLERAGPIVVRAPSGGGIHGGPFHSQNPEMWFVRTPGPEGGLPRPPRTTPRG